MKYAILTPKGIYPSYVKNWLTDSDLFYSDDSPRYFKLLINEPYFLDYLTIDVYEDNRSVCRYELSTNYWSGRRHINFRLVEDRNRYFQRSRSLSPPSRSRSRSPPRSRQSSDRNAESSQKSVFDRLDFPNIPVIKIIDSEPGEIVVPKTSVQEPQLPKEINNTPPVEKLAPTETPEPVQPAHVPQMIASNNIRPELQSTIDHLRDAYKTFHIGLSVVELEATMTNNPLNPDERSLISTAANMFKKFMV